LSGQRDVLDPPRIADHVFVELDIVEGRVSGIEIGLIVVVDVNSGIDVASQRRDEWLPL
jgi:hypothetical protein